MPCRRFVLRLFDHSLPLVVSVDDLPSELAQFYLKITNRSRTRQHPSPLLKWYFQIEKELLAVQFGLMRFRECVYGQMVVVDTDHKPLVGLLDKSIASCLPRIQRMRLQLQIGLGTRLRAGQEIVLQTHLVDLRRLAFSPMTSLKTVRSRFKPFSTSHSS